MYQYSYGGIEFNTKKALKTHIQKAIDYNHRVVGRQFFDDVLADLFMDRHGTYWGNRPTAFAYIPNPPGGGRTYPDSLAAMLNGIGWCRFSYMTLVDGKSFYKKFNTFFRERFARTIRPKIFVHGAKCAIPGCEAAGCDLDHITPQHRDIVSVCIPLISPKLISEWEDWEARKGGDEDQHFVLPDDDPSTIEYDRLSGAATYQQLCERHHEQVTSERAKGRKP